jgi:PAS domain S-box-containing protein
MNGPLALLLLEDSAFDAELLQEALRAACPQAACTLVRTESEFTRALQQQRFDAVLSDYEVPGFGGAQALQITRRLAPQLPFIFVSGVIGEDNAVELMRGGATDYVSKSRLARLPLVLERALREVGERRARDQAERKLREADRLVARIVESLRDYAVILLDAQGCITSWNQGAQTMFGFAREEVVAQPATLLLGHDADAVEGWRAELHQATEHGRAVTQRWMRRRDGSPLRAEGVLTPLHGEAGELQGFCSITRDTTADYLASQALRDAKDEAERASLAKDRFIAVLSHELRAPLAAVSSAVHLIDKNATVPERYRDLLPMIRRNVAVEARLIDDLLDISAISSGKLGIQPAVIDLHDVVDEAMQMLDGLFEEHGMRLELALAPGPALVHADAVRMQQVVANLLRNAVKFSERGGRIQLRTSMDDARVVLECIDEGVGIAPDALERIFMAFEQVDRDVSRQRGGLGLGLAIARHLAQEHGGGLQAYSKGPGLGARFTLWLPLAQRQPRAAAAPGRPADAPAMQAARVLLVEDHLGTAQVMKMCLEDFGYEVVHAGSVAQALQAAEAQPFDIVLTDLGLPDASGVEVGRALSGRMPVVALSGFGAAADLRGTADAGFSGHLVKPVEPAQIHALLQQILLARAAGRN